MEIYFTVHRYTVSVLNLKTFTLCGDDDIVRENDVTTGGLFCA